MNTTLDFGDAAANAAWAAQDSSALVASLMEAGWVPLDDRETSGRPSISIHRGRDVIIGRYPAETDFVLLIVTPAISDSWEAGTHDGIRDSAGSRLLAKPRRIAFGLGLSPEEVHAVGLS